jgi:hypothetical protein
MHVLLGNLNGRLSVVVIGPTLSSAADALI